MESILWCSIYSDMRFVDIPLFRVSHWGVQILDTGSLAEAEDGISGSVFFL